MEHIGMDLGKRESQIAILTEDGELVETRIRTERTTAMSTKSTSASAQGAWPSLKIRWCSDA